MSILISVLSVFCPNALKPEVAVGDRTHGTTERVRLTVRSGGHKRLFSADLVFGYRLRRENVTARRNERRTARTVMLGGVYHSVGDRKSHREYLAVFEKLSEFSF